MLLRVTRRIENETSDGMPGGCNLLVFGDWHNGGMPKLEGLSRVSRRESERDGGGCPPNVPELGITDEEDAYRFKRPVNP